MLSNTEHWLMYLQILKILDIWHIEIIIRTLYYILFLGGLVIFPA